jgi:hypothetical protein
MDTMLVCGWWGSPPRLLMIFWRLKKFRESQKKEERGKVKVKRNEVNNAHSSSTYT